MNNKKVFALFEYYVLNSEGIKRTKKEQGICEYALQRFKRGCLDLSDCYKNPSHAKISAFLECESLWTDYEVKQVCSSILAYNCQSFSWGGLWVDFTPDIDGYVTICLKYDTVLHSKLIDVVSVPYEIIK